ncbi:Protein NLRC3 [Durusdinium trenchii]|uniref:Protein NLRC3 n=1 Tax=Durusdinium trenchii TaxID=1381693 RepID=A0ABP0SEN8_9DINO
MYSLRNRDLTSLVGGAEASEAARAEPWLEAPSRVTRPKGPKIGTLGSARIYGKRRHLPATRDRARPGSAVASGICVERTEHEPETKEDTEERLADDEKLELRAFRELKEPMQAYKDLKTRFDNRGAEMSKLYERIRKLERQNPAPSKDPTSNNATSLLSCRQSCCIPLARLEKAGLNVETVQDLDAKWAGYVFSILSGQARSSGRTMYEIFRKYADAQGRIDEAAFRNLIRQFIPSMPEERLTRLFYFADTDGSGMLNLLEFLRLFGVDVDGKMGEEYFEHVMVRMRKAVAKSGGLVNVLRLNDRYLNRSYSRHKLVDAISPLAPSLSRAEIYEATARFITAVGDVNLQDLHDAMELCASSAFVSEDWVHKLFKTVSSAIQKHNKDLKSILKSLGQGGTVSREELRTFLRQFQPNLCDSHIDRVFGFLCASCPTGSGNLTLGHLVETICRPTLGPVQMGSNRSRLPLEDTSRLAVQLSQLCGGLENAFDHLNPCLLYEEFCTALQSLGFSHAFDFEKIFAVIDVHRSGRVPKSVFMSVLERFVQSITENPDRDLDAPKSSSSAKKGGLMDSDKFMNDMDDRLQYFRQTFQARRQHGRNQHVPVALHEELLWEFQKAVNRLLVLESELQYRQKQEVRDDMHMRRGLIDQVRDLEAALARLTAKKNSSSAAHIQQEKVETSDSDKIPEAWHAGYREAKAASMAEIENLQKELDIAKQEKIHLQLALSQQEERWEGIQAFKAIEESQKKQGSSEAQNESRVAVRFSGGENKVTGRQDTAEGAMLDALRHFSKKRNADTFASSVKGISIAGRFIVKEVLAVEFDSIVLACGDAFNMREVTLKMPITEGARTRTNFLRECCVYTVLSEVAEVQDVIHFPGLTSGLAYCVMERLHGRLLSQHLQRIRTGHEEPLPAHAAADICDAMLHGLEACHARGVTHLDLKPSVIWEVAQPAGVVVKILDFGLARLANLGVLPADARQFFRPGAGGSSEANPQLQFDNVLAAEMPVAPPKATDGLQAWMPLAPFAQLSGAGSCWYMSPSRWCGFAVASRTAAEQPTMRLCNVPSGNLWLERGPTQDIIGVSKITAASSAIQGAAVAMQLPEGTYFEVQLRKVWPSPMLPPGSDLAVGPAIGFTRIPPQSGFSALTSKAKDWPLSWVLGYDGRFFHDGAEAAPVLNSPHFAVHEFRRHRDAKLAAAGSGDTDIEWPTGPLGWSFVELLREDTLGLLAKRSEELVVYVNGRVVSCVSVAGLYDGGPLYPLLEICGVAREVAFVCSPAGPGGEEDRDERLRAKDQLAATVESLATRSLSSISDVYAAALVAQQVFQSHSLPEVPPAFVKLLIATQLWLDQGRPDVSDHNSMLIALTHWASTVQKSQLFAGQLSPEIQEVLQRVLESSNLQAGSTAIRTAEDFRAALNEKTACSHVPPEFLRSHIQQKAAPPAKRRRAGGSSEVESMEERSVLWDLTPWTLSASHVRRVMVVLQSQDGLRISSVNIGRLEANIPDQLLLAFAECFEGPSGCNASCERRALPRLLFRDAPLPAEACPVPLSKLVEDNAAVLLFHFVRCIHLQPDDEMPVRLSAKMIGSALRENWALEELKASNLHFEDRGMDFIGEALTHGCHLLRLELAQNRITAAGVQVLAQAMINPGCALRHLELQSNEVACAGCSFLAEMLRENNSLEYLGLQHNNIAAAGAVALGTALISNSCLEELNLGRNVVGAAGAGALAAATRSNSCLLRLNLQDNGLEILAGTTIAEELSAGMQMDLDGLLDSVLPRQSLAKRSTVTRPKDGVCGSQLVSLNLRHNHLGSIGGAAVVAALQVTRTQLSELNLAWNGLGLEAAAALANLLGPHSQCILTKLDLRDNRGLGIGGVLPKALNRLTFAGKEARDDQNERRDERRRESAQHLQWLNLANIDLDNEGASLLAPSMTMFSHLEELYLYNNVQLGCARVSKPDWRPDEPVERPKEAAGAPQGICRLARSLPASLTKLALGSCALGPRVTTELFGILTTHSGLEHLGLCDNDLADGDQALLAQLHSSICKFLSSSIKNLDLSLNNLGDECAMAIITTLAREQREIIISFGANKVSQTLRELVLGTSPPKGERPKVEADLLELLETSPWLRSCFLI